MLSAVLCLAVAFMGGMLYKMMRLTGRDRSNREQRASEVAHLNSQIQHYEQRLSAFETELSMFGRDLELQERQPVAVPSNIEEAVRLARDGVKTSTLIRNGFNQAEAELAVGLNAARLRHSKAAG